MILYYLKVKCCYRYRPGAHAHNPSAEICFGISLKMSALELCDYYTAYLAKLQAQILILLFVYYIKYYD
jgi:hypothetical protein